MEGQIIITNVQVIGLIGAGLSLIGTLLMMLKASLQRETLAAKDWGEKNVSLNREMAKVLSDNAIATNNHTRTLEALSMRLNNA